MAAAPSSCPVPTMTKDQKEIESNKRGTRLSEGFCEEWSQKSKGHVWFPLSNLPLLRRLGLYRRRLMLSISVGRYIPSKTNFTWDSLLPSLLSRVVVSIARRRFEPRLQVQSSRH